MAVNHIYGMRFGQKVLNIAYSDLTLAPMNSAEHFYLAAHLGFDALKGDVRITRDNGLILCHDEGFTLDENGRIGRYDRKCHTRFLDTDFADVMKLEYAAYADRMGYHAHVCDFDTYVRICKEEGKIVYATVRDNKIPEMIAGVIKTLRKYGMEEHAIINSFTYESLCEIRRHSDIIPVSNVFDIGYMPTREDIDRLEVLGNSICALFWYTFGRDDSHWAEADELMAYAAAKGVTMHMAIIPSFAVRSECIAHGIQGFHLYRAMLPYPQIDIRFTVTAENGEATLGNLLRADTLLADTEHKGDCICIRNIRRNGSNLRFDDGLPALWLNTLPHTITVSCPENPHAKIRFEDNSLILETDGIDGTYLVHVSIF